MTKALDTLGNEVELHGDSPLKLRLRGPKPFGAFKAKARTGNSHKSKERMRQRPCPRKLSSLLFPPKP